VDPNPNPNPNPKHKHNHAQALPALLLLSPGGERVIERWEAGAGAPAPPPDLLLRRFLSDATYQRIATLRQAPTPTLTNRHPNPSPPPNIP